MTPAKPYPDFPLFPHATKRWAKKIRGKLYYFGPWDDPDGALKRYLEQKDALHAGRKPRPDADAVTIKDVVNDFLNHKKALLDAGELSAHTWAKYKTAADEAIAAFGKGRLVTDLDPQDFASLRKRMAKKWGVYRLADMIQHVRSIFKHSHDSGLLPLPVRIGPGFARPTKKAQRLHRAEQGRMLFTAGEVRKMIDGAGPTMRAMILLGINAGFGNTDCAKLPIDAVDLEKGIIDFPRPKTGIARRCCLWMETVDALRDALAKRHEPKKEETAKLFFITLRGGSFQASEKDRSIGQVMTWLLRKLGINGRKRLGFYTLRHTFRTVADEAKDSVAADFMMGHETPNMSSVYRETISDLESADRVAESLEKVMAEEALLRQADDALRENANKIGGGFEQMTGTALPFEKAWRKIVTNVAKGQTAEMQAERTGLLNEFEKWLDILKKGYALLTSEHKESWTDLDPDFLLPEIAGLERLKARVFDRWQSTEDLEDLAARDYPLTTAGLDQIGPQRRPPDSWYAEESKPF